MIPKLSPNGFNKCIYSLFKTVSTNLLEVVMNPCVVFADGQYPAQIDGRTNDDGVALGIVDVCFRSLICSSPYPMAGRSVPILG